jgi:GTP-binding protein EngB required for normal cell division
MQNADAVSQGSKTTRRRLADSEALAPWLDDARDWIGSLGADFESERRRIEELHRRLQANRCHLAVLGQFKRGKSTLINALVGAPVLPAAVVPLTSIPTFLHGGEELTAQVVFDDHQPRKHFNAATAGALAEFLTQFVTEGSNPHNRLGVRQVEVTYPAPVLRQGLELIDTPGIGSTFRHNTEATMNFLPQCDAALFVVSADPPITEVEVEFLKLARQDVERLFFILNKIDYLDADERRTAVAFLQQVLCEQVGFAEAPPIFCTSARQGLAARLSRDRDSWSASGLAEVENRIVEFLLAEKADVLHRAGVRHAEDILVDIQRRLELMLRSLQLPLSTLEERIRLFEETVVSIEEQGIVLMDRLDAAQPTLEQVAKKYASNLLTKSRDVFEGIVRTQQAQAGSAWSENETRDAVAVAIPDFFEHELSTLRELCESELRTVLSPHRRRADELVTSVHQLVARLFDVSFEWREPEIALSNVEQPCWRTHKWVIKFGAIPVTWVDVLFPLRLRHSRIRRRVMEQVEYLVTRNMGYLRWSTLENIKRSVEGFRAAVRENLNHAIEATRRALEAAHRRQTKAAATVGPEMDRLKADLSQIRKLRDRLTINGS